MPKAVTDSDFKKEVLESEKPVLVDFWASWCMPCQMLTPILEEVEYEVGDKIKVCKVNVEENNETSGEYGIMSIPAVFLFKDGEIVEKIVGLRQKDDYLEVIEKHT